MSIGDKGENSSNQFKSVGHIVSKSIEEQNKYLYNYIHKLEFLVKQSQKERADIALKFKSIVSHIVHHLSVNNINSKNALQILKNIQKAKNEQDEVSWATEGPDNNCEQKDFLFEALGGGSKPFNNYESGYVPITAEKTKSSTKVVRVPWYSLKGVETREGQYTSDKAKVDRVRQLWNGSKIKRNLNKRNERFETGTIKRQRNNNEDSGSEFEEVLLANKTSELIDYHSQKLANLWRETQKKKREKKEKEKLVEEKEEDEASVLIHNSIHSDAFENISIKKRSIKESCSMMESLSTSYNYSQNGANSIYHFQVNESNQGNGCEAKMCIPNFEVSNKGCNQNFLQGAGYEEYRVEGYIGLNNK